MDDEKQLINYKKSFFTKIKERFLNFFNRKKKVKENIIKENDTESKEEAFENSNMSKEKFMEIYNKVKAGELDTGLLDEDTLYKIMVMLNEEIEITSAKTYEEIKKTEDLINKYNEKNENIENNS